MLVGGLALLTPQVLSTGHGALDLQLNGEMTLAGIALRFALKFLASTVSHGAGFRGGPFFASLFMGALLGKHYGALLVGSGISPHLDLTIAALVGMTSLASGVVGGPLTMTFWSWKQPAIWRSPAPFSSPQQHRGS